MFQKYEFQFAIGPVFFFCLYRMVNSNKKLNILVLESLANFFFFFQIKYLYPIYTFNESKSNKQKQKLFEANPKFYKIYVSF